MSSQHVSLSKRIASFFRLRSKRKTTTTSPDCSSPIRRQYKGLLIRVDVPRQSLVNADAFKKEKARTERGIATRGEARIIQQTTRPALKCHHDSITMTAPGFLVEMRVVVTAISSETVGRFRIGLVQGIADFHSQHTYVDPRDKTTGYARWELSTKECFDADRRKTLPFYSKNSYFEIDGSTLNPRVETTGCVLLDDQPYTRATWTLNLNEIGMPGKHYLKNAMRYEKFATWLVVQDRQTGHIEPLVAVERDFYFNVDVACSDGRRRAHVSNCSAPDELRPRFIVDVNAMPSLPRWCESASVDVYAKRPTANEVMRFVWYYLNGDSTLVPGVRVNVEEEEEEKSKI
ncbi:uncharacterized protein [Oscarella lobularis]|uniref:uncharacterized protein n=1 Tax=Oscarella lobularis TaxID=121494 RepID=UPI00331380CE